MIARTAGSTVLAAIIGMVAALVVAGVAEEVVAVVAGIPGAVLRYKLCLTAYKAMRERSPAYIRELIIPVSRAAARARLRSARTDTLTLVCSRVHHNYGERGFSFAGPSAWNSLSLATRQMPSLDRSSLRSRLNCLFGHIPKVAAVCDF